MLNTRSKYSGEINAGDIGKEVTLCGWVHRRRDHGGVIFIDLRDISGLGQIVFDPSHNSKVHDIGETLRSEYVVGVRGTVRMRPEGMQNKNLPSGEVELLVDEISVLNKAETPPFSIEDEGDVGESHRLTYRYLDLRRPQMSKHFILRHKIVSTIRACLNEKRFIDVETPVLTKATPEGARDFLVPSRIHPGEFYALPQSPQLFKQLLMISGFDRYYQIVKCFRDEDLRADRQPEFTQLDLEMSFVDQNTIFDVIERVFVELYENVLDRKLKTPLERLTHKQAMARFGTDKPDRRFGLEIKNLKDLFDNTGFKVLQTAFENGGTINGLNAKGAGTLSRTLLDKLKEHVAPMGVQGVLWLKCEGGKLASPVAKFFSADESDALIKHLELEDGDAAIMIAGEEGLTLKGLGALRLHLRDLLKLENEKEFDLFWVTDFPMFEKQDDGTVSSSHHPFTSPDMETWKNVDTDPLAVGSQAYDLVMDGHELGSGSIRIFDPKVQTKVFEVLNLSQEEIQSRFGFFIDALKYGTPPHGGIALGIDRLVALFAGLDHIRDVIAFPKTQKGSCLTSGAPSAPGKGQLDELFLKVLKQEKEPNA